MNDTPLPYIRRSADWRRLYLLQHPLAATMATAAILSPLVLALRVDLLEQTAIASVLPGGLEWAWLCLYGAGGALCWLGYWNLESRAEDAGLILQTTCYAVQVVASLSANPDPLIVVPIGGLAVGFALRAIVILTRPEVRPWEPRRP